MFPLSGSEWRHGGLRAYQDYLENSILLERIWGWKAKSHVKVNMSTTKLSLFKNGHAVGFLW